MFTRSASNSGLARRSLLRVLSAAFTGEFCLLTSLHVFRCHVHRLIQSPHSRTNWPSPGSNPKVENLRKNGTIGREGYVNVADQFGLSTKRGTNFSLYFYLNHSDGKKDLS
jgi:hypothetical protein